jgi:hypothetical protein
MTLHELTRKHGVEHVAGVLGLSVRALVDRRAGISALTVDDLHKLQHAFEGFDMQGTVKQLGESREAKGRSRRTTKQQCPTCHGNPRGCLVCRDVPETERYETR